MPRPSLNPALAFMAERQANVTLAFDCVLLCGQPETPAGRPPPCPTHYDRNIVPAKHQEYYFLFSAEQVMAAQVWRSSLRPLLRPSQLNGHALSPLAVFESKCK